MSGRFEDDRGIIQDLPIYGPVDAVTWIRTLKGAVRGNHVHKRTVQWTYVCSGRLLVVNGDQEFELEPRLVAYHGMGEPHAWKALEDTECLVFTSGPRSGDGYESDTERLEEPLIV